jgi:hypothetical protein
MAILIYIIHFALNIVSHRIAQRSHENEIILIACIFFSYFYWHWRSVRVIRTINNHMKNESLVPNISIYQFRSLTNGMLLAVQEWRSHIKCMTIFQMFWRFCSSILQTWNQSLANSQFFRESLIKWIIIITTRFCQRILSTITYIFRASSWLIFTWHMNDSKNANDHIHILQLF